MGLFKDAICEPKPLQKPHPPVWLGESKDEKMLEAIVKYADVWNSIPTPVEAYEKKLSVLRRACKQAGRDYATIEKTLETQILVCENDQTIDAIFERIDSLKPVDPGSDEDILKFLREANPALEGYRTREDFSREFVIGTPDEVEARIRQYVRLGVTQFMLWFMDFPRLDGIRLFAKAIMPRFR